MTRPERQISRLRILATSDLHMHVLPYDYFADAPRSGIGLQALAATVADLRREARAEMPARHTLLVDNGDTLQGTALGDHVANHLPRDAAHPLAAVMNALGYDAMGLGNHDLDFGLDCLDWFARSLRAPLVSSNTVLEPGRDWLRPHAMLTAGAVRVGVLSVLPPHSVEALHAQIGDALQVGDMIAAARRTARHLTETGADIVLGLAHTGIDPGDAEQALAEIARSGAVDALVGGHQHGVFPGPAATAIDADPEAGTLGGIPTVMPGFAGAHLGCIDLDLDQAGDGRWRVAAGRARLVPPGDARRAEDCAFAPIRPAHAATCAALDEVIADTAMPLTSYFARVRPTPIHALVAAAQRRVIDTHRAGTAEADLPLLSAVSLPRAGGSAGPRNYTDIPAGPLQARHVAELSIYANFIWAVRMSGADLVEWLEKSVSSFARIGDGTSGGLFDADFPAFDFDVIHGLTCTVDPTRPARYDRAGNLRGAAHRRVVRLEHDGAPVDPDAPFLVAVNSFRACGGGYFPGLHPDRPVLRPDIPIADALRSHLASGAAPAHDTPWRFADRCAGTRAWFETGPGALDHLDEIAHLSPGPAERLPSGFVRIPVTL